MSQGTAGGFQGEGVMKGRCLCGADAYEAAPFSGPIAHRSCGTCRNAHGAAFTTATTTLREHFRFRRGADRVASFRSSWML